jgi:hypothetical protein
MISGSFDLSAKTEAADGIEPDTSGLFSCAGIPLDTGDDAAFIDAARSDFTFGDPFIKLLLRGGADHVRDEWRSRLAVETQARRTDAGGVPCVCRVRHSCHVPNVVREQAQRLAVLVEASDDQMGMNLCGAPVKPDRPIVSRRIFGEPIANDRLVPRDGLLLCLARLGVEGEDHMLDLGGLGSGGVARQQNLRIQLRVAGGSTEVKQAANLEGLRVDIL